MRKKLVRIVAIVIVAALVLSLLMIPFAGIAFAAEKDEEVTILFTHDLHDHLLPVERTDAAGNTTSSGGYARLKTVMDDVRATHETTFTLDAGDFSMGSLFQGIFATDAPELRMMGMLGIEVTTFGNHEFDYGPGGLSASLDAAMESGEALPQLVQANYKVPADGDQASEAALALVRSMSQYSTPDYTVLERNGITLAVFGIMGHDSHACAPTSQMALEDPIEAAKRVVADIQANVDADMIVCLSHSGTWDDPEKSEDELLAKAVPEIDLIISGHTHTRLDAPIQVGSTLIASCGSYAENLGIITLKSDGARWTLADYELRPIDDSVADDPAVAEKIEEFKILVQEKCLSMYDMTFDQILARNEIVFTPESDLGSTNDEIGFGNLLADSYIYALKQLEGADYEPVALTAVPLGVIRASLPLGELTTSDAFDVLSLGTGQDGTLGYPLVEVYLTGKELSDVAEIDASVSMMMSSAKLYLSGISYTYNPNRLPLDFVTDVKLMNEDGSKTYPIEDKLYRVVTDMYSAQMFGSVKDLAYGFLSLTPKDAEGNEITDFNTAIIYDQNGNEVKAWQSLASYLTSFEKDEDGISVISSRYAQIEGRKILNDDSSVIAMLANPGPITVLVVGVASAVLIIFVLACMLLIKRWSKRHGYDNSQPERLQ